LGSTCWGPENDGLREERKKKVRREEIYLKTHTLLAGPPKLDPKLMDGQFLEGKSLSMKVGTGNANAAAAEGGFRAKKSGSLRRCIKEGEAKL